MLYITADLVNRPNHGGGSVTFHESEALKALGPCEVWDRRYLEHQGIERDSEPWGWDDCAVSRRDFTHVTDKLAHFYAGTFSNAIDKLKSQGCRIGYTAAAHDVAASKKAHEEMGFKFDYPHLTDPKLWERYLRGYKEADVLIVPSTHSERVMRGFGCANRIEVIPHGVELPKCPCVLSSEMGESVWASCPQCKTTGIAPVKPPPEKFTVGYLGSYGPDKGVRYLIEAWAKLNYDDAHLLLGGRDSQSPFVAGLVAHFGAKNVRAAGWVPNVSDFYNACSLYVQPSVTEGFGLEVLEAMAHGRPVIATKGCGATDLVWDTGAGYSLDYEADADQIAQVIDLYKRRPDVAERAGETARREAAKYTWDKIRTRYQKVWKSLL